MAKIDELVKVLEEIMKQRGGIPLPIITSIVGNVKQNPAIQRLLEDKQFAFSEDGVARFLIDNHYQRKTASDLAKLLTAKFK